LHLGHLEKRQQPAMWPPQIQYSFQTNPAIAKYKIIPTIKKSCNGIFTTFGLISKKKNPYIAYFSRKHEDKNLFQHHCSPTS